VLKLKVSAVSSGNPVYFRQLLTLVSRWMHVVGADDVLRTSTVGHDVISRMAEAVSSVSRMREFRRYVVDAAGRRLVQLWMDIERFHRIDEEDERSRWLLYREIQITFYEFHEAAPPAGKHLHADIDDVNCVLVGPYSYTHSIH